MAPVSTWRTDRRLPERDTSKNSPPGPPRRGCFRPPAPPGERSSPVATRRGTRGQHVAAPTPVRAAHHGQWPRQRCPSRPPPPALQRSSRTAGASSMLVLQHPRREQNSRSTLMAQQFPARATDLCSNRCAVTEKKSLLRHSSTASARSISTTLPSSPVPRGTTGDRANEGSRWATAQRSTVSFRMPPPAPRGLLHFERRLSSSWTSRFVAFGAVPTPEVGSLSNAICDSNVDCDSRRAGFGACADVGSGC